MIEEELQNGSKTSSGAFLLSYQPYSEILMGLPDVISSGLPAFVVAGDVSCLLFERACVVDNFETFKNTTNKHIGNLQRDLNETVIVCECTCVNIVHRLHASGPVLAPTLTNTHILTRLKQTTERK